MRRDRTALAGAIAGAAISLAVREIGAHRLKLGGLFTLAVVATAGVMQGRASAKAYSVESRLNNILNNGCEFGGDVKVIGDHSCTTAHINGTQLHMRQGPETSPPGGAPGTYTPTYESSLSQMGADTNSTFHNTGTGS